MTRASVLDLDPQTYRRHALHAESRVWVEKNCYVDIWIEMVHALGMDPAPMLTFAVAVDFEDDQWTFWKPSHDELRDLYGIDVQELTVWKSLLEHAETWLAAGKWISTEADSFWLPDTAGTDYRRQHVKTTIVLNDLDAAAGRLGYFHNAGYYVLEGEDFARTFECAGLPLYAESVRIDRVVRRPRAELAARGRDAFVRHLARRPTTNPIARFGARLATDLPAIQAAGLEHYHRWAFATVRQLGGAFEAAAWAVRWLEDPALAPAADAFDAISNGMKTLILKLARAVNAKRALDATAQFEELAAAWQRGVTHLEAALA